MEYEQMVNLYKINGLEDYQLKNTEDLLKVHGINFKTVKGYNELDDLKKEIYRRFIIRFINNLGLESRSTFFPEGIYYVEQMTLLTKENINDDGYLVVGEVIMKINKNGLKSLLHKWEDEDYKHLEIKESEIKNYLRIEYKHCGCKEWLHIIKDGKSWY